ncbi:MAG: NUDIX domain-containing protein [Clostridia bacterium]|nr:NUDIX domain-containing protein [Clostridia bacterium]
MKYEKSCGAVIWRSVEGRREYLLILNKKGNAMGHWGFPKGHVEEGETEQQTAKREILEETGIVADSFSEGFRVVSSYNPAPDVEKDSVYFLCRINDSDITLQESEVAEFRWCDFDSARKLLTFDDSILKKAECFLTQ